MPPWVEMMISLSIIVSVMIAAMLLLKNHKAELVKGYKVYGCELWVLRVIYLIALGSYGAVYLNGLVAYGFL